MLLNHGRQAKLEKSRKIYNIRVSGLHLTPGRYAGQTTCGDATPGCLRGCLNTCGRGGMHVVQRARQRKTGEFLADPWSFASNLMEEIDSALVAAKRKGVDQWFRLNLTSDIRWEAYLLRHQLQH